MRHKGRAGLLLCPGQSQIERREKERLYRKPSGYTLQCRAVIIIPELSPVVSLRNKNVIQIDADVKSDTDT